mgnify:CR=1 FL=1
MPSHLPKQLEAAIQAYTTAVPRRARLLDLAGAVLAEVEAATADLPEPARPDLIKAAERLTAGQVLGQEVKLTTGTFLELLRQLLKIFRQFELLPSLPEAALQELDELPPAAWLDEAGPVAGLASSWSVPPGLLLFIGQQALSPFYRQAAAPYGSLWPQGLWQHPTCPTCGRLPTFALILPENGQRHLHCDLCAVTWPASSCQACIFCGVEAAQTIYYFLEDDPARRADLCQACGRYLRTVVLARLSHSLYLPLEGFVLVDLDTLMTLPPDQPCSG